MMAVILRGQGFPGQLLTKVGKYDDVEPRSVWLRAMLRGSRMESEMNAELRFHIEAYAEDLIRSGVRRTEACGEHAWTLSEFHQLRFIEEALGWFWIREFSLAECPE
jgi:hypothetical protein